jgi:hypothetical protein
MVRTGPSRALVATSSSEGTSGLGCDVASMSQAYPPQPSGLPPRHHGLEVQADLGEAGVFRVTQGVPPVEVVHGIRVAGLRSIPRPTRRCCTCFPRSAKTWWPIAPWRSTPALCLSLVYPALYATTSPAVTWGGFGAK